MEGMPAGQHPHPATQQLGTQATAGSYPQQPPPQEAPGKQSADLLHPKVPARLTSAFLKKHKSNKKVRWDHSVVDNEKTPKVPSVRPPTPPLLKKVAGPPKSSALPHPSQVTSTSIGPVANTSAKMYSQSERPPQSIRPSGQSTYSGPDPWYQPNPMTQHAPAVASGRPPTYVPATQRPGQALAPNSASKRKANSAPKVVEIFLSTSKGHQTKTQKPAGTTSRVPPAVPDAPQPRTQGPPPTPRITRLPTPDLAEVSGTTFCTCDAKNCNKPVHLYTDAQESKNVCTCDCTNCNKLFHVKMNVQSKKPSGPSTQ
jgi:hypothetical protein